MKFAANYNNIDGLRGRKLGYRLGSFIVFKAAESQAKQAHIIVCGNEKGGSGKTTTAMHIIVYLLKAGYKVASIDLDCRQLSLTRYLQNRKKWQNRSGRQLLHPDHHNIDVSYSELVSDRENEDLAKFTKIFSETENVYDFIVIDTPGHDDYLMRLAHSMADTLVTPLNDSFIDFDVLGQIDPENGEVINISHYATMVRNARRHRRLADNGLLDWVVVRNRLSNINSHNKKNMLDSLQDLSMRLGCRLAEGITERVVFRELFPIGLTALDDLTEQGLGIEPNNLSHLSARQEVRQLIGSLRLPVDETGRKRAEARKKWFENAKTPLQDQGVLAD